MTTKRSSSISVESESPPSKRAKKEAELEKTQASIARFMRLLESFDELKETDGEAKRLSEWGLSVCKSVESFESGRVFTKPPSISNQLYGMYSDPVKTATDLNPTSEVSWLHIQVCNALRPIESCP